MTVNPKHVAYTGVHVGFIIMSIVVIEDHRMVGKCNRIVGKYICKYPFVTLVTCNINTGPEAPQLSKLN